MQFGIFLCMKYNISYFSHLHCIKSNFASAGMGTWLLYTIENDKGMIIVYYWKLQGYSV